MKAYSQDVRERVLRAVDQGYPRAEIVQIFGISLATLKRYRHRNGEKKGMCAPKRFLGAPPREAGTTGGRADASITGAQRRHRFRNIAPCGSRPTVSA